MSPTLLMLSLLRSLPAVAVVLGDRILAEDAPQGTAGAYAVIRPSGGERTQALQKATGHQLARMTVIVFAPTFAEADQAGHAIEEALRDYRGTIGGVRVKVMSEGVGVSDTIDQPKRYRRAMQYDLNLSALP